MARSMRGLVWVLVLLLLSGTVQGAWAAPAATGALPAHLHRYGQPVTDERLEELDGEWAHILIGGLYGAFGSALNYTIVHYGDSWEWDAFARSTAIGAVSGMAASAFGSPFLGVAAGSLAGGFLDRWW